MSEKNYMGVDTDFDFGFTAVTENELETVQVAQKEVVYSGEKLEQVLNLVGSLLTNLRADPEKDYIYWPNRQERIDAFEKLLDDIVNA